MKPRTLRVMIDQQEVGTLMESGAVWRFDYADSWLDHPMSFDLSPHLPRQARSITDGASLRPVQWYFDNLLPEENARVLMAKDARLDSADAFGLLRHYGAESAGSITLLPLGVEPVLGGELKPLSFRRLQTRIDRLPQVPLSHGASKRMSLAGAQHKLAVVLQDGNLFEPTGAQPSTHILKPNHPDGDYPHSAINEWFTMRLAKRMDLDVPNVHRLYVPTPVYVVDRFDRAVVGGTVVRRHAIDCCQLLGIDRSFKYAEGSMENLAKAANACRSPALVRPKLFSWLLFNMLVGNSDSHLKNISFLVSDEGVQLAPFYDLLCIGVYDSPAYDKNRWPDLTELAWPLGRISRFSKVNASVLTKAGAALGLGEQITHRIVQTLCKRIVEQAQALYTEVEQVNAAILTTKPELASTFAGELRCLRAIIHGVIQPMAAAQSQ
ncbi:MAG TPA: HipA domain-containing protein [Limnobacter sp.]|uniref:HipA domain-containing protein n=1 Tax=Limnobacter sp. TaxID=2003368 RepID=UPI002EDAFBA3